MSSARIKSVVDDMPCATVKMVQVRTYTAGQIAEALHTIASESDLVWDAREALMQIANAFLWRDCP